MFNDDLFKKQVDASTLLLIYMLYKPGSLQHLLDPRISWSAGCLDSSPGTASNQSTCHNDAWMMRKNSENCTFRLCWQTFIVSFNSCKFKSIWKVLIWGSFRMVTSTLDKELVNLGRWQLTSHDFAKEDCMKLPTCYEWLSNPWCPPQPPEFEGPSVHLTAESGAQSSLCIPSMKEPQVKNMWWKKSGNKSASWLWAGLHGRKWECKKLTSSSRASRWRKCPIHIKCTKPWWKVKDL